MTLSSIFPDLVHISEGHTNPVYAIIVPVTHYKVSVAMNTFLMITLVYICFISHVLTLH